MYIRYDYQSCCHQVLKRMQAAQVPGFTRDEIDDSFLMCGVINI